MFGSTFTKAAHVPPRKALRFVTIEVASKVSENTRQVSGSEASGKLIAELIGTKDREHFVVLHLDGKNRVISVETVAIGTLNAALVHPREVWKGVYLANANAIVCGHNHPSGDLTPSAEDEQLLERLKKAGEVLVLPSSIF
jgi:DNA repair protein RadC